MTIKPTPIRPHASCGATLIELVFILVMIACAIGGARIAQHAFGVRWLIGAALGVLAFFAVVLGAAALFDFGIGGAPRLPTCRAGCCRGPGMFRGYGDYQLQKFGEEYNNVCKCGGRYRRRGRRFVAVNEDGTETPYLIWRPFRGWAADSSS